MKGIRHSSRLGIPNLRLDWPTGEALSGRKVKVSEERFEGRFFLAGNWEFLMV